MNVVVTKPSKLYPAIGHIAPQSVTAATTVTSEWIRATNLVWLKLSLLVGAGDGAFAVKIEQATSLKGDGAKDLYTAEQLGITEQKTGHYQADALLGARLDINNGYRYVRACMTCTGGDDTHAALAIECGPAEFMD